MQIAPLTSEVILLIAFKHVCKLIGLRNRFHALVFEQNQHVQDKDAVLEIRCWA